MLSVNIKDVSKTYLNQDKPNVEVFKNFNLEIPPNQFLTIFGPNGCGKTTLLKIIAGLVKPESGNITIDSNSSALKVGYIFQDYKQSLFPWRTNLDNIAFPLEIRGMSKKDRQKTVACFLEKFGIEIQLNNYPYQLSGGQNQLVAIARALIYQPHILLMDEPFGSLDYENRIFMQEKILDIWRKSNITVIFVSHGIEEAIYLADRAIIFSKDPLHTIAKDIEINLPRPRVQQLKGSLEFANLLEQVGRTFSYAIQS